MKEAAGARPQQSHLAVMQKVGDSSTAVKHAIVEAVEELHQLLLGHSGAS